MDTLKSEGAVITGGSSGIGLATAKRFVAEGAYVIIAGRCKNELAKAVAETGKDVTAVHHLTLRRSAWAWPNPNDFRFKRCQPALAVSP